jgi:hypothetical protein
MLLPAAWCLIGWVGQRWWRALCALVSTRPTTRIYGEAGSRCAARWRLPLHPPPLVGRIRRMEQAGRTVAPSTTRGGHLFIPSGAADGGGSVRWWDGGSELLFPEAFSSTPLARRTVVAAGGGGTAAASSGPDPLVFWFFILLKTSLPRV